MTSAPASSKSEPACPPTPGSPAPCTPPFPPRTPAPHPCTRASDGGAPDSYLRILLPLAVVALSIARLAWSALACVLAGRRARRRRPLSAGPREQDHTALPPDTPAAAAADDDDDGPLEINGGRLALAKTTSRGSVVQADTPPTQRLSTVVEQLAIAALVAVNAVAAATHAYHAAGRGTLVAVAGLVTWLYALLLASLRLFLGGSRWRVPRLWNHTATLYGLNWLFALFVFRSALVHPASRLAQVLVVLDFALVSLLFAMALTTRKGNKTVLLEWEDGIEPSREPLASLFSLATFSWVDAIVYRGWKETMGMEHVWNLLPEDKAAAVIADYRQLKRTGALAWHMLKFFRRMLLFQCFMAVLSGLFTFAPTLLLKAIIEYVERPARAPVNVLWLYVIALPVLDTVRSYADGMALWTGRKICIRVRAIIIGDIYAKALRRKAAVGKDKVLLDRGPRGDDDPDGDGDGDGAAAKIKSALGMGKKKANGAAGDAESANGVAPDAPDAKPPPPPTTSRPTWAPSSTSCPSTASRSPTSPPTCTSSAPPPRPSSSSASSCSGASWASAPSLASSSWPCSCPSTTSSPGASTSPPRTSWPPPTSAST